MILSELVILLKEGWNGLKEKIVCKKKENVSIYVICLAALEVARPVLDSLGVYYYSPLWLARGISDHFEGGELKLAIKNMKRLESEFAPKFNGQPMPSFGIRRVRLCSL